MRLVQASLLLALSACVETGLGAADRSADPRGSDPPGGAEGWADPQVCALSLPDAREVVIDEQCLREPFEPPEDPWAVEVLWHQPAGDRDQGSLGVTVMPAVGNLTDDNFDGLVDDRDIPDIAYTVYGQDILEVRSGDDGRLHYRIDDVLGTAGVAIADVTNDGRSEVIAVRGGAAPRVIAVSGEGEIVWESRGVPEFMIFGTPVVADLEGDGTVEIVFDRMILEGATGEVRAILPTSGRGISLRSPVIADVDLDGQQDIFLGPQRFDSSGALRWTNGGADPRSVHVAIANLDDDPEAEILMVSGTLLEAFKADGTRIYRSELPSNNGGPPCVADFTGDGSVEIGIAVGSAVAVYKLDGTQVWTHPSFDSTLAHAGCSGYDFDGDGAYEFLHADQHTFYIFDGATGEVLFSDARHTSTTIFEFPVVADVNRDGSANIVIASNINDERPGWAGVTVYRHRDDGWARSGPTWGVHDFAVTNLIGDGTVPVRPVPSWLEHNVFRARPTVDSDALPDLKVRIEDVCADSCDTGPVRISYVVTNQGGVPVRAGTPVSLYLVHGAQWIHRHTDYLPPIPAGWSLAARELQIHPSELGDALVMVIDDDGSGEGRVEECDDTNNLGAFEGRICDGEGR